MLKISFEIMKTEQERPHSSIVVPPQACYLSFTGGDLLVGEEAGRAFLLSQQQHLVAEKRTAVFLHAHPAGCRASLLGLLLN